MPTRLVSVQDALRVLREAGPMSSDALARELSLRRLEARMILLHAHWHGLVQASRGGEWSISERGQEALAGRPTRPGLGEQLSGVRASLSALAWRRRLRPAYIARGGLPLALGAVVCAAGVAVASSNLPIAGPPSVGSTHVKRVRHHRQRHIRLERRTLVGAIVVLSQVRIEPSKVTVTVAPVRAVHRQTVRRPHRTLTTTCRKHQASSTPTHAGGSRARGSATAHHSVQRC